MLSFRQYIEAVQFPNFESNSNIESILRPLPKKEIVRFALEVAEDVFHLNNDQTRQAARTCLDLVHQWLDNPKSVSSEQLRSAASAAVYSAAARAAASAASASANAAYGAYGAACNAAHAYAYASGQHDQSIFNKQMACYKQWAINLRAEVTHHPDVAQLSKLLDAALKTRDKSMWYAVWDAASEQGLLPDNIDREDIEENPMNFYHMLRIIVKC